MDMFATINQLSVLFILLIFGYVGCKIKALTPETGKVLTKVVFNITLPCTILSSVIAGNMSIAGGETFLFLLIVFLVYVLYAIVALPTAWALVKDKRLRGLYSFMMIFSNVAFMGIPVVNAIFGPHAVFYVAVFNIPFWILYFSVGVLMISGKSEGFNAKSLINPSMISSLLVIPLALIGFRAPVIIVEAVRLTGAVTTPASMLIIGVTLASTPLRNVFTDWRLYAMTIVKLIVIPIITWFVFRPFISSELLLGVVTVLSGMPTAAAAAMFAIQFENNEQTASSGVFLTTLLCGVTIPLIVYLLLS